MIQRDEIYQDEVLLHSPPEKKPKTKKSKHKHIYEPCVFEVENSYGRLDQAHGFVTTTELKIGTCCPICGKVGSVCLMDDERWYQNPRGNLFTYRNVPTEEALKEFDPETRTLPFYHLDYNWWFRNGIANEFKEKN